MARAKLHTVVISDAASDRGRADEAITPVQTEGEVCMKIPTLPFTVTEWSKIEPVRHAGDSGEVISRTFMVGDLRVRVVECTPGYLADHWCYRSDVISVLGGELET